MRPNFNPNKKHYLNPHTSHQSKKGQSAASYWHFRVIQTKIRWICTYYKNKPTSKNQPIQLFGSTRWVYSLQCAIDQELWVHGQVKLKLQCGQRESWSIIQSDVRRCESWCTKNLYIPDCAVDNLGCFHCNRLHLRS